MAFILDVIVAGFAGGLVATIVMTVLTMVMMEEDDAMPTAVFASRFLNDEPPSENQALGLGLLAAYGIVAGIVLVGLADIGGFEESLLGLALFGLLFGVILWLAALFVRGVLGMLSQLREQPPDEARKEILGVLGVHLVFGLVAGLVGALVAGMV